MPAEPGVTAEPDRARPGAAGLRRAGRRSGAAGRRRTARPTAATSWPPRRWTRSRAPSATAGRRRQSRSRCPRTGARAPSGALRGALRAKPIAVLRRRAAGADLGCAAALAALQAGPGLPIRGRGRTVRFRRQRHQHHAGRCGRGPAADRRDAAYRASSPATQIDQAMLDHVLAGIAEAGRRRPGGHRRGRRADPAARRMPHGQGAAVRRDRDRDPRRIARVPLRCPRRPAPSWRADRRTAGRVARRARRCAGAQQDSGRQPGRGGHRRRWRGDPDDHPTTLRTSCGCRWSPRREPGSTSPAGAAVLAERGLAPDAATGLAIAAGCADRHGTRRPGRPAAAGAGRRRAGWRRSAVGDVPRAGLVAGRRAPAGEPVPYSGEDYTVRRQAGRRHRRPAAGGVRAARPRDAVRRRPPPLPWYKRPPLLFGPPRRPRCWPSAGWPSR